MKLGSIAEDYEVAIELKDFDQAKTLNEQENEVKEQIQQLKAAKVQRKKIVSEKETAEVENVEDEQKFTVDSAAKVIVHFKINAFLINFRV